MVVRALAVGGLLFLAGCSLPDLPGLLSGCTLWNQPPAVPVAPTGPSTGDTGTSYSFAATTADPEGSTISYEFDWDDGTAFSASGFVASGSAATLTHTYAADGTYSIRVRAIDNQGATSPWSPEHEIVIGGGDGDGGGDEEGDILWQVEIQGLGVEPLALSHPAIAPDGTIYVTAMGTTGTWTSRLVALRPDGTEKWHVDSSCGWMGHPQVAADGTIYVTLCGKTLTAFSPSGAKKWEFDAGHALGGVAVDDDGNVYGFHYESGAYLRTVFSLTPAGVGRWVVYLISSNSAYYNGAALVVGTGGRVYMSASSSGSPDKLFALNSATGAKVWEATVKGTVNAGAMAVGSDGTIYVPLTASASAPPHLVAVSAAGSILWDRTVSNGPSAPTLGADGTVYSVLISQGLTAFDPATGAQLWTSGDAPGLRGNAVAGSDVIYYGGSNIGPSWAPFIATNGDGTIRWRANIPCAVGSPAIASDGTVIVTGGTTVTALRGSAALASSDWPRALNGNRNTGSADEG
jgi:outer membrane protein assembly factor BamB